MKIQEVFISRIKEKQSLKEEGIQTWGLFFITYLTLPPLCQLSCGEGVLNSPVEASTQTKCKILDEKIPPTKLSKTKNIFCFIPRQHEAFRLMM